MLSVTDFIITYERYSDEELYEIHLNREGYSEEAQEAADSVIRRRGGLEELHRRVKENFAVSVSRKLEADREKAIQHREERKTTPRTVIGAIFGAILASAIGGVLWGLRIIYWPNHMELKIFGILLFGLVMVCYGIVKGCARKTHHNSVVLVATALSVGCAMGIGQVIFDIIGPK